MDSKDTFTITIRNKYNARRIFKENYTDGSMEFIPKDGWWHLDKSLFSMVTGHTLHADVDCVQEALEMDSLNCNEAMTNTSEVPALTKKLGGTLVHRETFEANSEKLPSDYYVWSTKDGSTRANIWFCSARSGKVTIVYSTNNIFVDQAMKEHFECFMII